jgi:hypothetical protein
MEQTEDRRSKLEKDLESSIKRQTDLAEKKLKLESEIADLEAQESRSGLGREEALKAEIDRLRNRREQNNTALAGVANPALDSTSEQEVARLQRLAALKKDNLSLDQKSKMLRKRYLAYRLTTLSSEWRKLYARHKLRLLRRPDGLRS